MNKKDVSPQLVAVTLVAAIIGIILASLFVHASKNLTATTVTVVPASFPDVKNNTRFNSFLNSQAIDPTQIAPVGTSQNNSPFTNSP